MIDDRHPASPLAPDATRASPEALDALRELTSQLQASRTRIVEASDQARRRLERDLHDGAQQRFVTASVLLTTALRTLDRGDTEQLRPLLGSVRDQLDAGIAELRDLARGIHPAILSDRGLRPAVDALAARCGLPVAVHGDLHARPAPAVESALYLTIAEALTNVAKHAQATEASVTLSGADGKAEVAISDDGAGGADPGRGSGLRGLVDRLGALGGHLHVRSEPGAGTTVRAVVPLDPHEHRGAVICECCVDDGACGCEG